MLALTRRLGERVMIGENIVLTVVEIRDGKVRIGIDAPKEISIKRSELIEIHNMCDQCGVHITHKNHGQTTADTTLCIVCLNKGK